MSELFPPDSVEMLSPRLAWLKRNLIETEELPMAGEEDGNGDTIPRWVARLQKPDPMFSKYKPNEIGSGDTEDEAIADLACKRGLRLWNEETA